MGDLQDGQMFSVHNVWFQDNEYSCLHFSALLCIKKELTWEDFQFLICPFSSSTNFEKANKKCTKIELRLFLLLAMKPSTGFAEFLSSHAQGGIISQLF